jgi:hypothetical protein
MPTGCPRGRPGCLPSGRDHGVWEAAVEGEPSDGGALVGFAVDGFAGPAGGLEEPPDAGLFAWVLYVQGVHAPQVGGFDVNADLLETLADHRVHDRFLGLDLARGCVPATGVAAVALGEQDLALADEEQVDVHDGSLRLSHARGQYRSPPTGAALRRESSYPDVAVWADYFLNARATDADAITAFGPRDGRSP